MNTYRDLKRGLAKVAKQVEGRYDNDPQLMKANEAALQMFSSNRPVYGQIEPGKSVKNITFLSLFRVNLFLRRQGVDWRSLDWDSVLEWLSENWMEILKLLIPILLFLI